MTSTSVAAILGLLIAVVVMVLWTLGFDVWLWKKWKENEEK